MLNRVRSGGEPRVSDAAACMKNAYEDEQGRIRKACGAREFVRGNFCPSAIGQRYADRLKAIDTIIESIEPIVKAA